MAALVAPRTIARAATAPADKAARNQWAIALVVTMATFMELLDTSISNVSLPHIAGGLGTSYDESTWVLTSYLVANANHPADERVAQPRLRAQALLHDVRCAIHREFFSMRRRTESGNSDRVPRIAGNRRRRSRARRTGNSGRYFPQGKTRRSFRALQHGDGHGAGYRAAARRMDHRQLLVAMGFSSSTSRSESCR